MNIVGFFGLATALLCAGVIAVSLSNGKVPARWPVPELDRRLSPIGFWLTIFGYLVGAVMGALLANKFIG